VIRRLLCGASYLLAVALVILALGLGFADMHAEANPSAGQHWVKLAALSLFIALGTLSVWVGLWAAPDRRWRRGAGLAVLLGVGLFVVLAMAAHLGLESSRVRTLVANLAAPRIKTVTHTSLEDARDYALGELPSGDELDEMFGDTFSGALILVGWTAAGILLWRRFQPTLETS